MVLRPACSIIGATSTVYEVLLPVTGMCCGRAFCEGFLLGIARSASGHLRGRALPNRGRRPAHRGSLKMGVTLFALTCEVLCHV